MLQLAFKGIIVSLQYGFEYLFPLLLHVCCMPTLMNERARLACFGIPIVALGVYGIAHNAAKWEGNVYEVKASAATSLVVG